MKKLNKAVGHIGKAREEIMSGDYDTNIKTLGMQILLQSEILLKQVSCTIDNIDETENPVVIV